MTMKLRAILLFLCMFLLFAEVCIGKEKEGIVNIDVNLNAPEKTESAKIWIPYPLSDKYQSIEDIEISGNFINSAVYREPKSGAHYLFAEWQGAFDERVLKLKFKASAKERKITKLKDTGEPIPTEIEKYLEPSWWIPTDGKVKEISNDIKEGKTGILEKARSVYDWVVENTDRDPNVRGCGLGIVEVTLSKRSGKCADLSSVYVALARSIGVPAREVFGLRLGKEAEADITGDYHCWAEFYLPGTGWVPVDPSDVRKIMLAEKLTLEDVKEFREYYFGGVDEYRIVLERGGRGITLQPPQKSEPVNYLMYPYAEIDGKALDHFEPKDFNYSVHYKQIKQVERAEQKS